MFKSRITNKTLSTTSTPHHQQQQHFLPIHNIKRAKRRIFGINYNDLDYFVEEVKPNKQIKFTQLKYEDVDESNTTTISNITSITKNNNITHNNLSLNSPALDDVVVDDNIDNDNDENDEGNDVNGTDVSTAASNKNYVDNAFVDDVEYVELQKQISSFLNNDELCYIPITPPMSPIIPSSSSSATTGTGVVALTPTTPLAISEQVSSSSSSLLLQRSGSLSPRLNPKEDEKRIEEYMKLEKQIEINTTIDNILKLYEKQQKRSAENFINKKKILIPCPTMRKYTSVELNIKLLYPNS